MTALFAATFVALTSVSAMPSNEIVVRRPEVVLLLHREGTQNRRPSIRSDVLAGHMRRVFERESDLVLKVAAEETQSLVAKCPAGARMTCAVRALRDARSPKPSFLVVTSMFRSDAGSDRFSALLIDLRRAQQLVEVSKESDEVLEETLAQHATTIGRSVDITHEAELSDYLHLLISVDFGKMLEPLGHFGNALGAVAIGETKKPITIELDGEMIGSVANGATLVRGIVEGRHVVAVFDARETRLLMRQELDVRKGEVVELAAFEIAEHVKEGSPELVAATKWSGITLVALGASLVVASVVVDPGPPILDGCFETGRCRPHRGFASLCELTRKDSSCAEGSGILAAPLGYSLVGTGATWWSLAHFFADDDPLRSVISIVAGLAVGGLSYGISAWANDSAPTEPSMTR